LRARADRPVRAAAHARRTLAVIAAAIATLALLALLAGCGSSTATTTKAQYVARVNAVCSNEKQAMRAIALSKITVVANLDETNRAREAALALIEAVPAPKTEAISPEWLSLRRSALAATKRISALGLGKPRARPAQLEYGRLHRRAESIASAYGLTECAGFASS
jgi:hypothetical protein